MKFYIFAMIITIGVFAQANEQQSESILSNTAAERLRREAPSFLENRLLPIAGGTARIVEGLCEITVENLPEEYFVQITPLGETEGLFVFNKTAKSFSVKEIGQGKSNMEFDYIVFANVRRDSMRRGDMINRAETVGGNRQPVSTATSSSSDSDN